MRTVGQEHWNRQLFHEFCPQGLDCGHHYGSLWQENQDRKKALRLQQVEERPQGLFEVQRGDLPSCLTLSKELQTSFIEARLAAQGVGRRRILVEVFHGDDPREPSFSLIEGIKSQTSARHDGGHLPAKCQR